MTEGPLRPDSGGGELDGETLYAEPQRGGNTFACGTCHALSEPAADGFRRPGHPIGDAANRPSYKNTQLSSFLDAVNVCRVEWMANDPFTDDDPEWMALRDWLQEQAGTEPAPALVFERVDPPTVLTGGDMVAGREFFNGACAVCHDQEAIGTERAPLLDPETLDAETIATRVRTSGAEDSRVYPGLSDGRMPFWSADRISDDELRDVIAFVLNNDPRSLLQDSGMMMGEDAGMPMGCDATHARVGQVATLTERFHGVGGTATVIDDCTIEITNFTFDGQGIDVRLYGGLGGDYRGGFSLSGTDLRRAAPGWEGETVYARLPAGRTLDELDGISVWCVPAMVNFGDGTFMAP